MTKAQGAAEAFIASVGVAAPPYGLSQQEGLEFLGRYFGHGLSPRSHAVLRKIFAHPSIVRRKFALERPENLVAENPDQRVERFTEWAVRLAAQATRMALAEAEKDLTAVSGVVVNTCTGFLCPGLATYLMEELGLGPATRVYDLAGGSGCSGAIPNLELAAAIARRLPEDKVVLSVAVEICSGVFQMGDDPSLLISNAIFADGAAAAVIGRRPQGFRIRDTGHRHLPEHREALRYVYRNGQLHNRIAPKLPSLAAEAAASVVSDLLAAHELQEQDIAGWAFHPGGHKIIEAVKEKLGLDEGQVAAARTVLAQYGNMSSPTVWFVFRELTKGGLAPGNRCLLVTFGAGLSAHAALLEKIS